ncbi:MAG: 6-bladed beta-propeller, partial [Gemmatimonadota bacterium]|nr:6-bladed beta-propeller [Gemmatimonadota bacterium]
MKRSRTSGVSAAVALVAVAACEPRADTGAADAEAGAALQYEIHDSAGIPVVRSRAPALGSRLGWVVGEEAAVTIGTRDATDAFQLYRVGDATRLADGRIVVANAGSNELLVFDADGSHLGAWAGEGDGPGEFWDLSTVRPWP